MVEQQFFRIALLQEVKMLHLDYWLDLEGISKEFIILMTGKSK